MAAFPLPGKAVRGSRSGVPVMALFDLLGRNWAMGVLWVLHEQGPLTFRGLQVQCESISPSVLNVRLKELRQAGLILVSPEGYRTSPRGEELYGLLAPLGRWSKEWAATLDPGKAAAV